MIRTLNTTAVGD